MWLFSFLISQTRTARSRQRRQDLQVSIPRNPSEYDSLFASWLQGWFGFWGSDNHSKPIFSLT